MIEMHWGSLVIYLTTAAAFGFWLGVVATIYAQRS